ncbi:MULTISPECIES: TetR/AcrR family transcriptional regulator [Actinomycetes]|uniref:TetR/AcrR family transcriptional regulator n=1 Tax=Microbacterium profundi TaxID=450380 RepID=A0ABV3LFQ2_9MICO|nr:MULTISPECIES: TetR/AcrR family transcriptional regulator [Microbacterium]
MFETGDRPQTKSERTRARIRDAAIASFIEHGYTDTTMRAIADIAEVSVSNAYYYYPSKMHLVQELYVRVQHEHAASARPLLSTKTGLVDRLRVVFDTGLAAVTPYRHVAPGFLAAMIPPDSPLNPLADESGPARELTVGLFREAVDGAQHRLPDDVAELLPHALFVGYLALVLRWTYDSSVDTKSTKRMLDAGLRILGLALPFVKVPGIHTASRELLTLVAEVRS